MHLGVDAEDFGADDGILGEVLRHAAADHEKAGRLGGDLHVGQLSEVGDRVDGHVRPPRLDPFRLVLHQPEAGRGVGKGGAEDRRVLFERGLDQRARLLGVPVREPAAHLADEGARRVGPGRKRVGDLFDRLVAGLQLLLVDVGVVDAVDVEGAQDAVVDIGRRLVVLEAKRLEEVHVDDGGACGDHDVGHAGRDHVAVDMHAAAGAGRAGEREPGRAGGILDRHRKDVGGAGGVARGEAHAAHGVDHRSRIVGGDVDVLDRLGQELGLGVRLGHDLTQERRR